MTAVYLALVVMAWVVFTVIALGVTILVYPRTWRQVFDLPYLGILYLLGLFVVIPFDRFFDEHIRELKKLNDETNAT